MKQLGYLLFSFFFHIGRVVPVQRKKAFLVMTHDKGPQGNTGLVKKELVKQGYKVVCLTREDEAFRFLSMLRFFLVFPFHMATSRYIFLDNTFLPMAYLHFSSCVKVVQLWHGTGTVKRFGQHVNEGRLKELEAAANRRVTHLFVSSDYYKKLYAGCFGIAEERVYVTGLPRTDIFFSEKGVSGLREQFFVRNERLRNKTCILYAPTFRDKSDECSRILKDMQYLAVHLPEEYEVLVRLHPHVNSKEFAHSLEHLHGVTNVSEEADLNSLLAAADVLITDYSSILFEFLILNRPMLFYAYDLEEFISDGRSFYRDYSSLVPGPVVKEISEVAALLKDASWRDTYLERREELCDETFCYRDAGALERIASILEWEKGEQRDDGRSL